MPRKAGDIRIKRKADKVMEHDEAPSGYVTLYHYKEPFMRFTEGFGYRGCLLFDGKTDKVQCHFCGDWFDYLPYHLHKEHNMRAAAYKETVGLNKGSALISESTRERLIATNLDKRMKNLSSPRIVSEATRKKISDTLKRVTMETQNARGTCPEQLKKRLQEWYLKLGHIPTGTEVKNLGSQETYIRVFGSMSKALRIAGIPRNPSAKRLTPITEIVKKSIISKIASGYIYTDDGLMSEIHEFEKTNGREPAWSDCARGLLSPYRNFRKHFGNLKKAVEKTHKHYAL